MSKASEIDTAYNGGQITHDQAFESAQNNTVDLMVFSCGSVRELIDGSLLYFDGVNFDINEIDQETLINELIFAS